MSLSTRSFVAATVVAAALTAGCASDPVLAPVLLTLPGAGSAAANGSDSAASAAASAATSQPLLAVRRIAIPEYLVARRVRYRADPSTLAEWPNTFWAERIEIGVSREFVSALRPQLPGWSLCENNCGDRAPTLAVQVDMVPMDYMRSAQRLQARARVVVSSTGSNPRVLQTQEWTYELPAGADTAQAHAQTVTELIRQVATATASLVRAAAPQ
jgi:uncharacterized lipoprotein YmbA